MPVSILGERIAFPSPAQSQQIRSDDRENAAMTTTGLVTLRSKHDFDVTVERLLVALKVRETTVFARIDHAAGAASIQLPLRPTTLLIFGNAKAGTPLMQAAQTAGIDLPLKILVW